MRYCIFCGVRIPTDAKFCQICGKKQPQSAQVSEEISEEKTDGLAAFFNSPQKIILTGIGGFILFIALATMIMFALLK